MICSKCAQKNPAGSRFCENCGAPLEIESPREEASLQPTNQLISPGIIKGEDGILRWVYEMNMWKNPTLVITIGKVLLLAALVPALLTFFLTLSDGLGVAILMSCQIMAIVAVFVGPLMLLAYPLVALINGGKYCVIFEMDENSIKHIQMQSQYQKNQVLQMLVVLGGAMAGNVQTTAAGMLAGSKQSLLSSFDKVKTITVNEKRHVIYVNEKLTRNQVYANPEDFGFVRDYLISHCKNAKVTYQ